jgi:hypothetical protein
VWKQLGLLSQALCFVGETSLKRLRLFEASTFDDHTRVHSVKKGGRATVALSTGMNAQVRAGG